MSNCRLCHRNKLGLHCNALLDTSSAVRMMVECEPSDINNERINAVACNVIFLCAVNDNEERLDLRRDSLGVWIEGHRRPKLPYLGACRSDDTHCDTYVWRQVMRIKAYAKLKRTEIYRRSVNPDRSPGKILSPVFFQYLFDDAPIEINVQPHGNSKGAVPFHPADRSLLKEIRQQASETNMATSNLYTKVSTVFVSKNLIG